MVVYRDLTERCDGCSFTFPDDGGSGTISDRCGTTTYVAVHGVPFDFPADLLCRYFACFGQVLQVQMNAVSSRMWMGFPCGTRTLTTRLRGNIPSSVMLLGYPLRVFCASQPRTCFRCGLSGQQAAGCVWRAGSPLLTSTMRKIFPCCWPQTSPPGAGVMCVASQPFGAPLLDSAAGLDADVSVGVNVVVSVAPAPAGFPASSVPAPGAPAHPDSAPPACFFPWISCLLSLWLSARGCLLWCVVWCIRLWKLWFSGVVLYKHAHQRILLCCRKMGVIARTTGSLSQSDRSGFGMCLPLRTHLVVLT
nr:uncharacterized protein LOC123759724 [Procambarus clarkii]